VRLGGLQPRGVHRGDGRRVNILIDCGKTFRDTVLRTFPALGVTHLDAVFLTHGHADAFMGLDDLRDVSLGGKPFPIYTSAPCFEVVSRAFAYLVKKPEMKEWTMKGQQKL
jgi:phosphoribosyl 1,2-cyclic phosphodiesterase